MLNDCSSNSTGRDLAEKVDEVPVQYGVITTSMPNGERIAFGDPSSVRSPKNGMLFNV